MCRFNTYINITAKCVSDHSCSANTQYIVTFSHFTFMHVCWKEIQHETWKAPITVSVTLKSTAGISSQCHFLTEGKHILRFNHQQSLWQSGVCLFVYTCVSSSRADNLWEPPLTRKRRMCYQHILTTVFSLSSFKHTIKRFFCLMATALQHAKYINPMKLFNMLHWNDNNPGISLKQPLMWLFSTVSVQSKCNPVQQLIFIHTVTDRWNKKRLPLSNSSP